MRHGHIKEQRHGVARDNLTLDAIDAERAAITIRKPTFSLLSFCTIRNPSRKILRTLLRTTAPPSFVDTVRPILFIVIFCGWAFANFFA